MDTIKFIQLYNLVEMGIPGTTRRQLIDFIQVQDQERQRWLDAASLMDVADWVLETMRSQSKGSS